MKASERGTAIFAVVAGALMISLVVVVLRTPDGARLFNWGVLMILASIGSVIYGVTAIWHGVVKDRENLERIKQNPSYDSDKSAV